MRRALLLCTLLGGCASYLPPTPIMLTAGGQRFDVVMPAERDVPPLKIADGWQQVFMELPLADVIKISADVKCSQTGLALACTKRIKGRDGKSGTCITVMPRKADVAPNLWQTIHDHEVRACSNTYRVSRDDYGRPVIWWHPGLEP